jgi:hypothetical protein
MEVQARRISYQALGKGVPVRASGAEEVGTVEHVLQVLELDVFDGIVLMTSDGLRFADADQIADITDQYVTLTCRPNRSNGSGDPRLRPSTTPTRPSTPAAAPWGASTGRRPRRCWPA